MQFKEWLQLQEIGTGTNAIAVFSRPIFGAGEMIRRTPIPMFGKETEKKKKKKKS